MMQATFNNTTFGTPTSTTFGGKGKEFGSFAQMLLNETVEDRMSNMMESYVAPKFASGRTDRNKARQEREEQLQALVDNGVLRPSDVFVKIDGKNTFLAKLLPGNLSYHQRIRENKLLFREFGRNEGEQMRIIQEIIESVWLNEGRFLTIDNASNAVVMVEDKELLAIIATDLICADSFPAPWEKAKKVKSKKAKKCKASRKERVPDTSFSPPNTEDAIGLKIATGTNKNGNRKSKGKASTPTSRNVKSKQQNKPARSGKLDSELKSGRTTHKNKNRGGATGMKF